MHTFLGLGKLRPIGIISPTLLIPIGRKSTLLPK